MNTRHLAIIYTLILIGCTSQADKDRVKMQGLINKRNAISLKLDSAEKNQLYYRQITNELVIKKIDSLAKINIVLDVSNMESSYSPIEKSYMDERKKTYKFVISLEDSLKRTEKEIEDFKLLMVK